MVDRFEDRLWADLLREHGTHLAEMPQLLTTKRDARRWLLGGGALGIAGTATALALAFSATTSPPAYAVTSNSDGTVTVTIHELRGVTAANAELARLGVRARVVPARPGCLPGLISPGGDRHHKPAVAIPYPAGRTTVLAPGEGRGPVIPDGSYAVTLRPNEIPASDTVLIAAREIDNNVSVTIRIVQGPGPTCTS